MKTQYTRSVVADEVADENPAIQRERSFEKKLTRKKKQNAVIQMIAQRISENNIKVVDKIELSEVKTRQRWDGAAR